LIVIDRNKERPVLKHIRNLSIIVVIILIGVIWYLTRPDIARVPITNGEGVKPEIGAARQQTIPTVKVAEVDRWKTGEKPVAAAGLKVERYAGDLDHPRNIYMLPNGDVLVAETNSPPDRMKGLTGMVGKYLLTKAGAGVPSANRITLLRDGDGDGVPEVRTTFLTGLNAPFGMALIGDTLYVANTDAVMAFPYKAGDTQITGKGSKIFALNARGSNNHWTRNLAASADGKKLYISVGSSTNIGEDGPEVERGRAMVIELDLATRKGIPFAIGMRNPVGLAWDNQGRLWATVNERDMLGSDLVPDYLAQVEFGADYGWPQHYWGGYTDYRVQPPMDEKREYERRPDYGLGAHVAPLGLAFADTAKLGEAYASGAFIGRHGSWNRSPFSGYDVVFVKFENGRPVGKTVNVLSGFLTKDGKAKGRPTMVAIDKTGALLVSDDVGNAIWRVSAG
jgi:glucose/arabinose dehydrogenase